MFTRDFICVYVLELLKEKSEKGPTAFGLCVGVWVTLSVPSVPFEP